MEDKKKKERIYYKEEPFENFIKAVESSILKCPVHEKNRIYLSDLWVISSLPIDIIEEIIKKHSNELHIPEDIEEIYDPKRNLILWRR